MNPISSYIAVGDRRSIALIGPDGSVDFLCLPRFDSPACFCRLLDRDRGGSFRIDARGAEPEPRRYLPDTCVAVADQRAGGATIRSTELMPSAAGPARLLRRVEALSGAAELEILFHPTFDFARSATTIERAGGSLVATGGGGSLVLRHPPGVAWTEAEGGGLRGTLPLRAGERAWFALADGSVPGDVHEAEAEAELRASVEAGRRIVSRIVYEGPFANELRRSALTLRLLWHEPTGAPVAAGTTSLPADRGGVRNWDYRYTWLRDAAWISDALIGLGLHDDAMAFWRWVADRARRTLDEVRVLYRVDGEPCPPSAPVDGLAGYDGSRPVRVGNAAAHQLQLDVPGEILDTLHRCSESMPSMRPLSAADRDLVERFAARAATGWTQNDHGMWEMPPVMAHTTSRLMSWVALDRAVRMVRRDGEAVPERWLRERERISHRVLERCWNEELGAFTHAEGGAELDAGVLLLPLEGLLPPADPRVDSTIRRIRERLGLGGGLIRRYDFDDGLPGRDGAFLACSLWLASLHARRGERDEAFELIEEVCSHAGPSGLLSEQAEPGTGLLLGNHPQGLSHAALVRAILDLASIPSH